VNTQCSVQKLVGNRILSSVCCQVKVLSRIQAIGGSEEQKSTRDGATAFARATGPAVGKSTTENRRLPNLFENKRLGCCYKAPKFLNENWRQLGFVKMPPRPNCWRGFFFLDLKRNK
jgi:hypothetical protein